MKAPAFQFYAADYLADERVQIMTLEEEGCYIRLLAFCWREGSIPADDELLSRLCKGASNTCLTRVRVCFEQSANDVHRLVHKRLDAERKKQQEYADKKANAGVQSGKSRREKKLHAEQVFDSVGGSVRTECEQKRTLQSSSSSSNIEPPIVPQGGPIALPDPKTKKPAKVTADFDEDWPKFWLKRGKETALRAYEKARKRASREEIMAGVERMGPVLLREAKEGDRSPLHPATWLNRGGWTDEIEPAIAMPGTYPVRDGPGYGGTGTPRMSWRGEAMKDLFYPVETK